MTEVTLITGGSTGIGAAAARQLLKRGHGVAVTGRDPGKLTRFARSWEAHVNSWFFLVTHPMWTLCGKP